jgi:hypothetical protein
MAFFAIKFCLKRVEVVDKPFGFEIGEFCLDDGLGVLNRIGNALLGFLSLLGLFYCIWFFLVFDRLLLFLSRFLIEADLFS